MFKKSFKPLPRLVCPRPRPFSCYVHNHWDAGELFASCFNPNGTHYYCAALRDTGECATERLACMTDNALAKDPEKQRTPRFCAALPDAGKCKSFGFLFVSASVREARPTAAQHSRTQKM